MRGGDEEEEDRELNANPLQNHMRVQLPSTMSRKDGQLEGRLDDLLSRIAMETQEIKELEQQLTNQILANEALQRDLQEATTGLQDYLRGLRQQARRSQQQVHVLQTENQSLRRLLQDSHRHCRMVQDPQQEELSALWTEVQALRVRQAELEAELQQLRAEPAHQTTSSMMSPSQDPAPISLLDLNVQLDQFYPTRLQLERLPDSLPEPKNQTEPQHGASSTDSLSAERVHGSAHQNRTGRQEVRPGQNQTVEQNLAPSLASQGTQDSGLELQYLSSPDRGRHQEALPSGGRIRPTPHDPTKVVSAGTSQSFPAGGRMSRRREKQGGRCVSDCLEEKKMQRSLRRHRSVLQVCDELVCLEETLVQRRAELRQADRLLLEAQNCRRTARRDADSLQYQLDDSATCLLEATGHLRELQDGAELLRRKREEEERRLRKMEEQLRSRQEGLQQVESKVTRAANRLADLLSDCREARERLDSLTCQEQHSVWLPRGSRELEDRRRRTNRSGTRTSCPPFII
ncbi:centriolin-like isoform X4 [Gambusia affinis]|uniref:centriolin-like isoform X4 n=1 Tax=Gambusia affinis TaxID=33528 RepID=UPI001CDD0217|nr:centriolin-like isoform X4 [Gambusia affinis]